MLKCIENFIDKRLASYGNRIYSIYAATLKNERIRLQMTLEDITKGLCSKSYVSKIENNLLVPDEHILKLLFERVNLDYEKIVKVDKVNNLPLCMKSYLYHQYDKIEEMYQNNLNNDYFFVRDSLIKSMYYLIKERYNDFTIEIKNIDEVKNTLNDYELIMLLVATIEYHIKTHQFIRADQYLNILSRLPIEEQELKLLYLQQRFIVSCNLCDRVKTYQDYMNLINHEGYPLKNEFNIKLMFLETFPCIETIEELKNMEMDYIPDEYHQEYYYSKALILVKLGYICDVIDMIIAKKLYHVRFIAIFAYCLFHLQKTDRNIQLDDYFDCFDEFHKLIENSKYDAVHMNFLKLMIYELKDNESDKIFDYLKNNLIANLNNQQHRFYSVYYAIKYVKALGKRSRYKEAYTFSLANPNLLTDFNSDIYKF